MIQITRRVSAPDKNAASHGRRASSHPEDAWFIIPVRAFVPRTGMNLFPKERGDVGMYARYREAWGLLRGEKLNGE